MQHFGRDLQSRLSGELQLHCIEVILRQGDGAAIPPRGRRATLRIGWKGEQIDDVSEMHMRARVAGEAHRGRQRTLRSGEAVEWNHDRAIHAAPLCWQTIEVGWISSDTSR